MSSPSQVESIFFAALEKKTPEEQAEYLDEACGTDVALRHRVERLLNAHPKAMDFLAQPAGDRPELDSGDDAHEETSGLEATPTDAKTSIVVEREPRIRKPRACTRRIPMAIQKRFGHRRISRRCQAKRPHRGSLHLAGKNRRRRHGRGLGRQAIGAGQTQSRAQAHQAGHGFASGSAAL